MDRPGDDQRQTRIRLETESILLILDRIDSGEWVHLVSEIVLIEIDATPDIERRRRMRALLPQSRESVPLTEATWARAAKCQAMGFGAADAVHIAAAEALRADVLLSCDDRLCRAGRRNRSKLHVRIENPLSWLEEQ